MDPDEELAHDMVRELCATMSASLVMVQIQKLALLLYRGERL